MATISTTAAPTGVRKAALESAESRASKEPLNAQFRWVSALMLTRDRSHHSYIHKVSISLIALLIFKLKICELYG
jgi:hypothetical protein